MRLRLPSRISIRLLLFNVLLVLVPVAGFLYLDIFEDQLLADQERAMVQQGRLLAASLGGQGAVSGPGAEALLRRLERRTESRLRVFGKDGALLADSSRLGPRKPRQTPADAYSNQSPAGGARDNLLYRAAAGLYRFYRSLREDPVPGPSRRPVRSEPYPSATVREALHGRYGATVRPTGGEIWRPSLTLYSAIPVRGGDNRREVVGAVLVSQSTVRILRELDEVRLDVFKVFLVSVGVAAILSLLLAGTITHPVRRLRDEANDLLDRRGRLRGRFGGSQRADEIGDLARALEGLTARIAAHQHALEAFASDVSHELKNPLAAIRSATELLAEIEDPKDRERFAALVLQEVARMERLLSGMREIGEIDAHLETEAATPVDLSALLAEYAGIGIELRSPTHPVIVNASPERLSQVFVNLLDNARSFSPPGGTVTVALDVWDGVATVQIEDQGPGIPETHLGKIFDRFFTYRPGEPHARDGHTGLGLAIAKAIVEGYGGTITAGNRPEGGARFEVRLPRAAAG